MAPVGLRCLVLGGMIVMASCAGPAMVESRIVSIRSNVDRAVVEVDGEAVGDTPYQGRLPTTRVTAEVRAEGFRAQPFPLSSSFHPAHTMDVFLDYSVTMHGSENVWEYAPNAYYVELHQDDEAPPPARSRTTLKAMAMTFFADLQVEVVAGGGPLLRVLRAEFFPRQEEATFLLVVRGAPSDDPVAFAEYLAAWPPSR